MTIPELLLCCRSALGWAMLIPAWDLGESDDSMVLLPGASVGVWIASRERLLDEGGPGGVRPLHRVSPFD